LGGPNLPEGIARFLLFFNQIAASTGWTVPVKRGTSMSITRIPKKVELIQDERVTELETDIINLNKHIDMQVESMRNVMNYADEMTDKNNSLQEELTSLKDALERSGTRDKEHGRELEYLDMLLASKKLSGEHKNVIWSIRRIMLKLRYDLTMPMHIWIPELVKRTGLSDKTVRSKTNELHAMGIILKDTRGEKPNQETWFSFVHMYSLQFNESEAIPEKKHGKQKCQRCGSEKLEKMTYRCKDCGEYGAFE
jgi:hypothetical protein